MRVASSNVSKSFVMLTWLQACWMHPAFHKFGYNNRTYNKRMYGDDISNISSYHDHMQIQIFSRRCMEMLILQGHLKVNFRPQKQPTFIIFTSLSMSWRVTWWKDQNHMEPRMPSGSTLCLGCVLSACREKHANTPWWWSIKVFSVILIKKTIP